MTIDDIVFMLWLCRPEKTSRFFDRKKDNWYGWSAKDLYDFVENPAWGVGDYFEQLLFGCIAALDVYTENEICTILDVIKQYRGASNE